jgi:hypothetical protein
MPDYGTSTEVNRKPPPTRPPKEVAVELKAGRLRRMRTPWLDLRRQITVLVHCEKYLDLNLQRFLLYCGIAPL